MSNSYIQSHSLAIKKLLTNHGLAPATSAISAAKLLIGGSVSAILLVSLPVAQSLAAPDTAIAPVYPLLSTGSTGAAVSQLQATLQLLGFYSGEVSGNYSAATQEAVARFQAAAGISADGIAGPSTWAKLLPAPDEVASIPASQIPVSSTAQQTETATSGPPILRPGIEGSAVSQLQQELTTLGYYKGAIDGGYGELTQSAVRAFQSDKGLVVDAIVGPSTWDALTQALAE